MAGSFTLAFYIFRTSKACDLGDLSKACDLSDLSKACDLGDLSKAYDLGDLRDHLSPWLW